MYVIQIYESLKKINIIYENRKDKTYNTLQSIFTYLYGLSVVNNCLQDILKINVEFGIIKKMISFNSTFKILNQILSLKC